jgi:hypothetical protein
MRGSQAGGVSGSQAPRPRDSPRAVPKCALFAIVGLMALFVLWNNERFFLNPQAPESAHYNPIRWHLLPHGLGGTLTLALGALQFSTPRVADRR